LGNKFSLQETTATPEIEPRIAQQRGNAQRKRAVEEAFETSRNMMKFPRQHCEPAKREPRAAASKRDAWQKDTAPICARR
jgi:hypothetical protein